jgi:hypothetical protein
MLIGRDERRDGYWTDPETGEQVKILPSHPIHSDNDPRPLPADRCGGGFLELKILNSTLT